MQAICSVLSVPVLRMRMLTGRQTFNRNETSASSEADVNNNEFNQIILTSHTHRNCKDYHLDFNAGGWTLGQVGDSFSISRRHTSLEIIYLSLACPSICDLADI